MGIYRRGNTQQLLWRADVALQHDQRGRMLAVISLIVLFSFAMPAPAAEPVTCSDDCEVPGADTVDYSVIEGEAFSSITGLNAVNQAAGIGNSQGNSTAMAIAPHGRAVIRFSTRMLTDTGTGTAHQTSVRAATIRDNAFSYSRGATGINQAAGTGNLQHNARAIAVGRYTEVSDAVLMENRPAAERGDAPSDPGSMTSLVGVNDKAFSGAAGLIQLNQTAGAGNATANQFVATATTGARGD